MSARLDVENDEIIFSSGRKVYAHRCIIGLSPELDVYHGHDGMIDYPTNNEYAVQLTANDMEELADLMIESWTKYKASLK